MSGGLDYDLVGFGGLVCEFGFVGSIFCVLVLLWYGSFGSRGFGLLVAGAGC